MLIHLPPVGDDTHEGNLSAPGEHAEAEPGAARREGRSCLGDTAEDAGVSSGSGWAVQVGCLWTELQTWGFDWDHKGSEPRGGAEDTEKITITVASVCAWFCVREYGYVSFEFDLL